MSDETPATTPRESVPLRATLRWFWLGSLVGVAAGVGAIVFYELSHHLFDLAMGFAGYHPVGPRGESGTTLLGRLGLVPAHVADPSSGIPDYGAPRIDPWLALLIPTLGGAVVGLLVQRFAPEAKGHGTDGAIEAFHRRRGHIHPRVIWVKTLASAITLGTGGSGGREGPIAQIGAGFGSWLGQRLRLSARERRMLLAVGMGAGVGAIFRAPLAGALFAAEILYSRSDFESEVILPSIIACVISYSVFTWPYGQGTLFATPLTASFPALKFHDPSELVPYTVLGLLLAGLVVVYSKTFYGVEGAFERLKIPAFVKPALGGLLTGAVALLAWKALGDGRALNILAFGYGAVQEAFDVPVDPASVVDPFGLAFTLGLVALLKILSTSLTIGSGGSAGVFGPSMVIGGAAGAAVGLVFQQIWPGQLHPGAFCIVGMAGFFTGAAGVPISTLIMVSEITGSYALLLPVMWVESITFIAARRYSIYRAQVPYRTDSPAHAGDFFVDVLENLTIDGVLDHLRAPTVVRPGTKLGNLITLLDQSHSHYFLVIDEQDHLRGIFTTNDIRRYLHDEMMWDLLVVEDVMTTPVITVTPRANLATVMRRFTERNMDEIPVMNPEDPARVLGMLRRREVIAAYNGQLETFRTAAKDAVG